MNLLPIFLTGLLTGGLTCLAVQGGLLAATIGQRSLSDQSKAGPLLAFLGAKLVAYTILGMLLGWFGSFFHLSLSAMTILQFVVAGFMIGTALNMLQVHPIFRYFVISPPRFLTRMLWKQSKHTDLFAPIALGAFTVFIPCGTTQAMMALAIGSGSPLNGAAILFTFVLGTSPVFFLLGYGATRLGSVMQSRFATVTAYAILALALYNVNSAVALSGSRYTVQNIWTEVFCTVSFCPKNVAGAVQGPVSEATITIGTNGYSPKNLTVKAGSNVTLHLVNNNGGGCAQALTIPKLNIQKVVPMGTSDTITFTAPIEPGPLSFMCSMGMFEGTINVI